MKEKKDQLTSIVPLLNKKIILLLFLSTALSVNSQNTQTFHIPDSLKNKTYKELFKGLNSNYNDTVKEKIYAKAYLNKAKNEQDTLKIANAYSQYASLNSYSNIHLSVKYADSIIELTKNIEDINYPSFGYMLKGMSYFNLGNYDKALNNYLITNNYATKNNNIEQLFYINNQIGTLKNLWGDYHEGLEIFKSQLQLLLQNKNTFVNQQEHYYSILYHLSNSYILNKKLDSALIYSKEGLLLSLSINDSATYYKFVNQTGVIAYYQNNFEMALDSINKAIPYSKFFDDFLNVYYYKGQIYDKQKKDNKAFYQFKKADSIYNIANDVVPEVRDIQEYFVNYYKKNNDIENQLLYIDRLLFVDSIIDTNYKNLNKKLIKQYDTPKLISEKEKIISNLKAKEEKSSFAIAGLIALVLLIISYFIWLFRKQHILKKLELNEIKKTLSTEPNNKPKKELPEISKEIIKSILVQLDEFELANAFLDNKLTLNSLSKTCNTNSNYLSKVINTYKKKNFSAYISDLRLEYCIKKLKTDPTFRKYTINGIAFEIGFNNVETFSKAFFKKTGVYPSYFIKEIEDLKNI